MIGSGTGRAGPARAATTNDRLARVLRKLRWPVAALWVLAVVALLPLANGLAAVTNGRVPTLPEQARDKAARRSGE